MDLLLSLGRRFLENPYVGRQLASSFQSFGLGFVFTLVTLALGAASFFVLVFLIEESPRTPLPQGIAGAGLHTIHSFVLYGLLALLLPVRVAGSIDGPRNDKAFDQVVASGWSPLNLHLGNWTLAWVYALFILIVSLPYAVFAYSLGGVTWGRIAGSYAVLALYAHVIIGVSLGLCMLETERRAALLAAIFFLGGGALCAFSPLPSAFAEATPLRLLARWIVPAEPAGAMLGFWIEPLLFFTVIPLPVYPFLLWLLLLAPAVTLILLGPSHRFTPGLNNFGQVVLPGDRKRKFFRRPRPFLNRRVELAFFYENRPRRLAGWDFLLRKSVLLLWVFFLWGSITGLVFQGTPTLPARQNFAWGDGGFLPALLLTGIVLFVALLSLADTRHRRWGRERIGPWRLSRGLLLNGCAFLLMTSFIILHAGSFEAFLPALGMEDAFQRDFYTFLGLLTFWILNAHLVGRIFACFSGTVAATVFLVVALGVGTLFASALIVAGVTERWLPEPAWILAFASPATWLERRAAKAAAELGPYSPFIVPALTAVLLVAVLAGLNTIAARARSAARASGAARSTAAALLLVFATAAVPARAGAAERLPLDVELTRGFGGRVFGLRSEYPFDFFTAVIRNRGERPLTGTISVELDGTPIGTLTPFTAPQGTTTVVRWSEATLSRVFGGRIAISTDEGRLEVDLPEAVEVRSAGDPGWRFLMISDAGRPPEVVKSEHAWAAAKPFHLPEDLRAYVGVTAVLVGPTDLSLWTRGQREALYDYLRLGGTVIFFGRIDRAALKGAAEWEDWLSPRDSSTVIAAGVELAIEEFDGAAEAWSLDGEGKPVPLLSWRAVGTGRLGHLSFDPARRLADLERLAGAAIWDEFEKRMPRSAFPAAVEVEGSLLGELVDASGLMALAACSLAYTAVLGPCLAILFRKKKRRRWIPAYVLGAALLFAAGTPVLGFLLHSRPSPAALTRTATFGAGARRGVALARLELRSNGRQRHQVTAAGSRLRAFGTERFGWEPLAAVPEGDAVDAAGERQGGWRVTLDAAPWSARGVTFIADAMLAQPITGKVIYEESLSRVTVEISGLPPRKGMAVLVLENVPRAGGGTKAYDLSGHADGPVSAQFRITDGAGSRLVRQVGLGARRLSRPRALLAVAGAEVPLSVSSPDVVLDDRITADAARTASPGQVFERDGQLFLNRERTLILQELALEIR
jgi:hypothetical protein